MRALVVYESMYGNTRKIAQAIAEGISEGLEVKSIEVGDAALEIPDDVDLLVVGGPTHAHGMSRTATRASAATQFAKPLVSDGIGIREWLDAVRPPIRRIHAAAFDTRARIPAWASGSAANGFAKLLEGSGFRLIQKPRSFFIQTKAEPVDDLLATGELEQARAWGLALATALAGEAVLVR
jgi:Flavodoxin